MCWVCWISHRAHTASHGAGVVHTQKCRAEGHQPSLARLERLSVPAVHTAACSWVARGTAMPSSPASTHTCCCLLVQQHCAARHEQMCHQKHKCIPQARTCEGASSEPRAQDEPSGASARPATVAMGALWVQPLLHAQYAQHTQACSALQGAIICCRCLQVWCSLLPVCTHLHSPCVWKRRGRRGISHKFSI